jgi:hypothetical protein
MVSMLDGTGHEDHPVGHLLHPELLESLQRSDEEKRGRAITVTAPEAESPRPVALFPPTVLSPTLLSDQRKREQGGGPGEPRGVGDHQNGSTEDNFISGFGTFDDLVSWDMRRGRRGAREGRMMRVTCR